MQQTKYIRHIFFFSRCKKIIQNCAVHSFYRCLWTYDRYPTVSWHRHTKTCTVKNKPIFCLFSQLARPFVSVSFIFSPLPLCSPLLTIQESLLSSWPEGATGCRCQFQGHQMGAVIIIAPPLSCQCARQQNKRDPLEVPIKSFGLWSWSKRKNLNSVQNQRGMSQREPQAMEMTAIQKTSSAPPLPWCVDVRGTGVWAVFDLIAVRRRVREWVMQWCCR